MRRTKEDAQKTKQKILEAALKLFNKKGYSATTISMIIEESGTSKGAVYWHFKNKKEILENIISSFLDKYDSYFRKFDALDLPAYEKLSIYLNTVLSIVREEKRMRDITEFLMFKLELTIELDVMMEKLLKVENRINDILYNIIEELAECGFIAKENVQPGFFIISSFMNGIWHLWARKDEKGDDNMFINDVERAINLMLKGLG